jgi:hypothetical protein
LSIINCKGRMGLEAQGPKVCFSLYFFSFYYANYFLRIDFVNEQLAARTSTVNVNTNIRMHGA